MATMVLETPFDPQALFTALNYVSNVFSASSWQNLLKLFFMIALINGIISVGIYHKADYFKQFLIALGFASVLSIPIGDTLAIKRSDTEKIYTINNSKAPFILVYTINTVNSVTKWFTKMAGASINAPNYNGMYDAGIGSNANIIRNSMDMMFKNPDIKADTVQFIKECTLYDIRDGAISLDALVSRGNGFDTMFNNTSPARFVSIKSSTGQPELKTCQEAARYLDGKVNYDVSISLNERAANFFYHKDMAPLMIYSTAVQSSYQTQLNINTNVSQIAKQNMFNHLLEASGEDIGRLISDPAMSESAAIHMGTARAAKKAAFQQSIIAQLGKELLPTMSSWFAIIIIMLFPFVVLLFVVTQFNNMLQILVGYMGTLFWICCWQPIFAIINGLANWELGRQLAKTGAFRQDGIPYGYVHTVYDTLLNNHAMVGWMVILTPIIAGMVVYGTYRGFSHLSNGIFSSYQGSSSAVGNEMSDGNLSMGNTTIGNNSLANSSQNTTSINKYNGSTAVNSGVFSMNDHKGTTSHQFLDGNLVKTQDITDIELSEYNQTAKAAVSNSSYFSGDHSFGARRSTGYGQEQTVTVEDTQRDTLEKTHTTGTEDRTGNTTYSDNNRASSSGTQTNQVIVIGSSKTSGEGTSNSTSIHDNINTSKQDMISDGYSTSNQSGWSVGLGASGSGSSGGKGGKGGLFGALGALANVGLNTGTTQTEHTSSGSQSITSNDKGIRRDESTVSHTDNTSFINTHQQTGQVNSNIRTNTVGNRHEQTNSSFNSDTTATINQVGQGLTKTTSGRITEDASIEKGFNQQAGQKYESSIDNSYSKNVNLGLIDHSDLPAHWVHDNDKELFDDILNHYGIDSTNGMNAYLDSRGEERRGMRLDFAEAQIRLQQNQFLNKKPESGGILPTGLDSVNQQYSKFENPTKQQGVELLNNTESNYTPKR